MMTRIGREEHVVAGDVICVREGSTLDGVAVSPGTYELVTRPELALAPELGGSDPVVLVRCEARAPGQAPTRWLFIRPRAGEVRAGYTGPVIRSLQLG
jgi:hypothetical protein